MEKTSVKSIYITKEIADALGINPSYLIRLAKSLKDKGDISDDDMRPAGSRNYLFSEKAKTIISNALEKNKNI